MSEDVNIEILDGGLGILPASPDEVHAVIGCSSLGSAGSIVATRSIETLRSSRGDGPGVEAAAFALQQTGKTVLFCKAASADPGEVDGADAASVAIASSTNATPIVVTTSAPHLRASGDIVVIASHLVNTAANGTWKIEVLSSTTFRLIGSVGIGIGGATGTMQATGVTVQSITGGTSKPTLTGVPVDTFRFRWKWVVGGNQGASGPTFKYSLDGGATYSATLSIGTSTSYEIPDSGLTIHFSTGTFVALDEYRFTTTGPLWNDAGVSACIDALGAATTKFRLIHLVGDLDASSAVTFSTDLQELENEFRYVGLLGHARDFAAADTDEDGWIDALAEDFASYEDPRVSVTAGHYQVTSPITQRKYRRPLSFVAAARLMGRPIQEHAGRVRTGSLKGISIPSASDTVSLALESLLYHDSRLETGLRDARFFTARTRIGRPGLFADRPKMMSSPSSDFQIWPHRSVLDKACDITYEILVDVLNDDLQVDPVTGFILEKEAKAIESRLRSAFRDGLTAKRAASSVIATIGRTDNILSTSTLTAKVRVVPKGYADGVDASVGFTNPDLQLATA